MSHFMVIFEINGIREWWTVIAKNTMHAKDIICEQHKYNNVIFIDVDFANPSEIKKENT